MRCLGNGRVAKGRPPLSASSLPRCWWGTTGGTAATSSSSRKAMPVGCCRLPATPNTRSTSSLSKYAFVPSSSSRSAPSPPRSQSAARSLTPDVDLDAAALAFSALERRTKTKTNSAINATAPAALPTIQPVPQTGAALLEVDDEVAGGTANAAACTL